MNSAGGSGGGPSNGFFERGGVWVAVQIVLLAAIVLVPRQIGGLPTIPDGLATLSQIAGLIVGAIGLALVGLSALYLGRNLSIFPAPVRHGELTQTGLYALVRHPMYGGVILSALGWALFRASLPALVLALILAIFFDRKAQHEEKRLAATYPEYAAYRRRVRKLIPFVY